MTPSQQDEFLKTVGGLFDGTLTYSDEDAAQLARRLAEDPEASALYLKIVAFDVGLQWSSGALAKQEVLASRLPLAITPAPAAPAGDPVHVESKPIRAPLAPPPRGASLFSRATLKYVAFVAICLYGSFVLVAWNLRSGKLPSVAGGNEGPVAFVCGAANVQWSKNASPKSAEAPVQRGESLKIDSGLVELELKRGAKLVIEGPAQWSIDGDNLATLRSGKLVAKVSPSAIGFTVRTATATVIDLGTEFGVEADDNGATQIEVFKGKVELRTGAQRDSLSNSPAIMLAAGTARRVEPDGAKSGVIVREATSSHDRFVRQLSSNSTIPRQIRVEGVYASSTYPAAVVDARYLTDGSGLKEGRYYSVTSQNSMWHSAFGQVKNVVVSFDFAQPYRLQSMRVWNFNAPPSTGGWMGLKQADIYVSISGKGDPLSQPADWKLIVADQPFAPATGTPDYATPTVVPLADVKARFVAIVVDESLGHDPRENPQPDMVGLSEVQFFGNRVESAHRGGIQRNH